MVQYSAVVEKRKNNILDQSYLFYQADRNADMDRDTHTHNHTHTHTVMIGWSCGYQARQPLYHR